MHHARIQIYPKLENKKSESDLKQQVELGQELTLSTSLLSDFIFDLIRSVPPGFRTLEISSNTGPPGWLIDVEMETTMSTEDDCTGT